MDGHVLKSQHIKSPLEPILKVITADNASESMWEVVPKNPRQPHYDPIWDTDPCIAVTKNGITFNRKFSETFGVREGVFILVMFNTSAKQVGIQVCQTDTERMNGFKVVKNGSSKGSVSLQVACKRVYTKFPESAGKAYKAKTIPGSHVFFVDLA